MINHLIIIKRKFVLILKMLEAILIYFMSPFFVAIFFTNIIFHQRLLVIQSIIGFLTSCVTIYFFWLSPIKNYKSLKRRTQSYIRLGNCERAIYVFKLYLERVELNTDQKAEIILEIARLNLLMGKFEQAEFYFEKLSNIELDEFKKGEKLYGIGMCYLQNHNYNKAADFLDKGFEIAFKYIDEVNIPIFMLLEIMKAYISTNQSRRAEEIYQILIINKRIKKNRKIEKLLRNCRK